MEGLKELLLHAKGQLQNELNSLKEKKLIYEMISKENFDSILDKPIDEEIAKVYQLLRNLSIGGEELEFLYYINKEKAKFQKFLVGFSGYNSCKVLVVKRINNYLKELKIDISSFEKITDIFKSINNLYDLIINNKIIDNIEEVKFIFDYLGLDENDINRYLKDIIRYNQTIIKQEIKLEEPEDISNNKETVYEEETNDELFDEASTLEDQYFNEKTM